LKGNGTDGLSSKAKRNIACLIANGKAYKIGGYILMKKAKIMVALLALASFVLSAGAYITWR
jgi:hypothetical protein